MNAHVRSVMSAAEFLAAHKEAFGHQRALHDDLNNAHIERDFPIRTGSSSQTAESDHGIRASVSATHIAPSGCDSR